MQFKKTITKNIDFKAFPQIVQYAYTILNWNVLQSDTCIQIPLREMQAASNNIWRKGRGDIYQFFGSPEQRAISP